MTVVSAQITGSPEGRRLRTGRPRKFLDASRPVTVTLPERTLERLASIDTDRAKAIVKAVDAATAPRKRTAPRIEVVEVLPGTGVILVPATACLARIPGLRLAEMAPGRFLLTILPGTPIESLEVALADLLEDLDAGQEKEKRTLAELIDLMRRLRQGRHLSKAELLFTSTRPGPAAS